MFNNSLVRRKLRSRTLLTLIILSFLLGMMLGSCAHAQSNSKRLSASVQLIQGGLWIVITNVSDLAWTNVKFQLTTVNSTSVYEYSHEIIFPDSTQHIDTYSFTSGLDHFNALHDKVKSLKISADLSDGNVGTYEIDFENQMTFSY